MARPAHWNLREIRRFMLTFGPLSSLFDFLTFAVLLHILHAEAAEFRTGWFVESLATQTLIIFVIRTHAQPFWRSHPSLLLVGAAFAGVLVALALPYTPLAGALGFTPLPPVFLLILAGIVVAYLTLVDRAKRVAYSPGDLVQGAPARTPAAARQRRTHRRAATFTARARRLGLGSGGSR